MIPICVLTWILELQSLSPGGPKNKKNGFTMVDGIHCGGCAGGVYEYTQFLEPAN